MSQTATQEASEPLAVPPIVDQESWEAALADLRVREKAATRELDAIAAARRRLPMVELPDYTLEGADGPEYWIGYQNFYVITRYNRSINYAMAVWELATAIKAQVR